MKNHDIIFLIALNNFKKFGRARLKKLQEFFPSWKEAFHSSWQDLIKSGIKESVALEFVKTRQNTTPHQLLKLMIKENIGAIELGDERYPELLSQIYDPPIILFYKGDISLLNTRSLSIVGTRKNTPYGQRVAVKLCSELVDNNFTIVSGLALGIDTIAHSTAIDNKGKTIAVLGAGIDSQSIYPPQNRSLAEKIIKNQGLIISEFALKSSPLRYNFPLRNRIISGLSLGTLVIESAEKSGALITARSSLEQNRETFAVPGNIFSNVSAGPNKLIKQGAIPVSETQDILEALDLKHLNSYSNSDNKKIETQNKEEEKIVSCLKHEAMHIDELVRLSGLDTQKVSSTLTIMEVRGVVKNMGGMQYILS